MVAAVRSQLIGATAASTTTSAPVADRSAVAATPAACLVVNPLSRRGAGPLAIAAARLATANGAEVARIDSPERLQAVVAGVLERRLPLLIVLAGDGTVRGVVDQLARLPADAFRPLLLLLPGGRSNLTARDLMPRGRPLAALQRALAAAAAGRGDAGAGAGGPGSARGDALAPSAAASATVVRRRTLGVDQPGTPRRYGFFVAAGVVDGVIRQVHAFRARGVSALRRGDLGTAACLAGLALRAALGRPALQATPLRVDAGACGRLDAPVRLFLATTLRHDGALHPYPRRGDGELRVSAVARGAAGFGRRLFGFARGRWTAGMDAGTGWLGGRCEQVTVTGLSRYSLDGEACDADPARPLTIGVGPELSFLVP